jgi:hypothetical protein
MTTVRAILPALRAAIDTATALYAIAPILRHQTMALAWAAAMDADGTQCHAALNRAAKLITSRMSAAAVDLLIRGAAVTDAQCVLRSAARPTRIPGAYTQREYERANRVRVALEGLAF